MYPSVKFLARVTDAQLVQPATMADEHTLPSGISLTSVVIDSRMVQPNALFVCLPGENADGHHFAPQAVEKGCAAILASRNPFDGVPPVPLLLVKDVASALRSAAIAWRDAYAALGAGRVVGLTGTAGKTTAKEVLAQIMSRNGLVSRTLNNFNNSLGLPLSILNANLNATCWIMEAGISLPGDMDELGAILRPDIALILNVGPGHAAGLGDKGVAHYKTALLKYVRAGGQALVSADYPDLVREARAVRPDLIFFSATGRPVLYRAAYIGSAGSGKGIYRVWLDGESIDAEAPFRGSFGAENVVAIAATAHLLGGSASDIAQGLSEATLPKQRFTRNKIGNWLIIDDTYNANPLSMARMLEAAAELATDSPLVCVLGEMKELGAVAEYEHEQLGRRVAENRVRILFWKGGHEHDVREGLSRERFLGLFQTVDTADELCSTLAEVGMDSGVILFKGSRSNHMETLVSAFTEHARGTTHAV